MDANQKIAGWMFYCLHNAVKVPSGDDQPITDTINSLVMQAVDAKATASKKGGQDAACAFCDYQRLERQHGPSVGSFSTLRLQILMQGSAHADIEQLRTSTNAEQRQSPLKRIVDDGCFKLVACSVIVGFDFGFGGIKRWFDVVTACHHYAMIFMAAPLVSWAQLQGMPAIQTNRQRHQRPWSKGAAFRPCNGDYRSSQFFSTSAAQSPNSRLSGLLRCLE